MSQRRHNHANHKAWSDNRKKPIAIYSAGFNFEFYYFLSSQRLRERRSVLEWLCEVAGSPI